MMRYVELGTLMLKRVESLNPSKYPEEIFEYYSIPAYDKKEPSFTAGKEIGSSKKVLQSGDVILSRIVPHIRRCWVVESEKKNRKIGSGEWIVFRSENVCSRYLKYYLLSDEFNYKFLKTVKGVGGSLMRADPKQVEKFQIPLPPLPQQKKIAAILDAADAQRQKTQAIIEQYDALAQSLFLDMFGDPVTNPKGFDFPKLGELCKVSQGMQIAIKNRFSQPGINRFKYITVAYLNGRKEAEYIENPRKSVICSREDILMTRTGNTGQVIYNVEGVFHNNFFKVDWDKTKIEREFLIAFLSHSKIKQELLKRASTTTIPDLNHGQFYDLNILLPEKTDQKKFVIKLVNIQSQKAQAQQTLNQSNDLFNSLLQKAFKGTLTLHEQF